MRRSRDRATSAGGIMNKVYDRRSRRVNAGFADPLCVVLEHVHGSKSEILSTKHETNPKSEI
jgi:hypothetical protein